MTREEEAIEALEEMIKLGDLYEVDINACEVAIDSLKRMSGYWIRPKNSVFGKAKCSVCSTEPLGNRINGTAVYSRYCPYCGARMNVEGGEKNE